MYLIKANKHSRITKNVGILILIILLSVFVCACQRTDNNSNLSHISNVANVSNMSNVSQRSTEVTQTPKKDELQWSWCIKPAKYSDLFFVDNDLIAVKENNGKYVIVDTSGKKIIPFEYSEVGSFEDGLASVKDNKNAFFINRKGENVFDKVYEGAYDFSCGLAAVKKDGHWGFIDKSGDMVIKNQFNQVNIFKKSFAVVEKNSKWGLIDKSGNIVVNFQYDCINDFHDGLAAVEKGGKWGFIDKSGKIATKLQFDEVEDYSEGFAAVMKNDKWGFINKSGKINIALKYDEVGNFSESKASVKLSNYNDDGDEWAYINSKDNIVIDFFPYDAAGSDSMFCVGEFHNGLAFVSKTLVFIIDKKGKNIFMGDSKFFINSLTYNSEYDAIPAYTYTDDAMKIRKYGLMGLKGNQRLEPIFDYIRGIYGDYVVVENIVDGESKVGLIKIFKEPPTPIKTPTPLTPIPSDSDFSYNTIPFTSDLQDKILGKWKTKFYAWDRAGRDDWDPMVLDDKVVKVSKENVKYLDYDIKKPKFYSTLDDIKEQNTFHQYPPEITKFQKDIIDISISAADDSSVIRTTRKTGYLLNRV